MTNPLTPREKVARIVDPVSFQVDPPRFKDSTVKAEGRCKALLLADAILTALASGSGDHAELALNAKAAQTWALGIYENRDQAERRSKFIDSDLPATVLALLAENAALRAERDWVAKELRHQANCSAEKSVNVTEAECKLAEAYRTVRQFVAATSSTTYPSNHPIWAAIESAQQLLSKEAERG